MKRLYCLSTLLAATLFASAIPAQHGRWKNVKLSDGTEVRVELVGDEYGHYWRAADGVCYMQAGNAEYYEKIDLKAFEENAKMMRSKFSVKASGKQKLTIGSPHEPYEGTKKGLIILASFPDMPFKAGHDNALYQRIVNEENFTSEDGFVGSVRDYFKAQSGGKFVIDFDIVGPVEMPNSYSYYGKNNWLNQDSHPDEMVVSACQAADSEVNFADYDWDNDGIVDQVFVVYAGMGEATGGESNTIWPHASQLSSFGHKLFLDGVRVDTYACGNEMRGETQIEGIGTICHEFSHCLGLPDMYDTGYKNFGMSIWDIMAAGSHNNNGFIPAAYTSYERMYCGWEEPIEVTAGLSVTDLQPISNGGGSYIMYNEGNRNEYYLLENRQMVGWDAGLPSRGLLVMHVDFDAGAWARNQVNTTVGHQRCTIIPADNSDLTNDDVSYSGDLYPHGSNNSITPNSVPSNSVFNKNVDGSLFMDKSIVRIKQNADGTVAFDIINNDDIGAGKPEGAVFYESFDLCIGEGGNDNVWSGSNIGTGALVPDNNGWTGTTGRGGDKCAKFGTNRQAGRATTPYFAIDGENVVTFKAAPWEGEGNKLTLSVGNGEAELTDTTFPMESGKWNNFVTKLTGKGDVTLIFRTNSGRFFLDDIAVVPSVYSSITDVYSSDVATKATGIYTLDGRFAGNNLGLLKKGIYIVNGKKVVK